MTTNKLTLFLLLLVTSLAQGQYFQRDKYDWDEPEYEEVNIDDSTDTYYILERYIYNYHYDDEDQFALEKMFHVKIHLNSESAVSNYNKISISQSADLEGIHTFKARVINPDGSVKSVDKGDVLVGEDEESGAEYSYLALDGTQIGSQVEYFYIKQLSPSYKGIKLFIEGRYVTERFELDVISPGNLVFEGKVYNYDTIQFSRDTSLENENRIYLALDSVMGVENEVNAFRDVNLAQAIFKLDRNNYNGQTDITSYSHTTQDLIDAINREYSKGDEKALKKLIKDIDGEDWPAEFNAIRKIEDYIKENYQFIPRNLAEINSIQGIYENKAYSYYGGMRLFSRLFKHYDIPFKMVYTCERSDMILDEDFQSAIFLQDILFYMNDEDEYIDYTDVRHRLGYINPLNRANNGLFMEEARIGDQVVGVGEVLYIEPKGAAFTIDTIVAKVEFDDVLENSRFKFKRVLSGYSAANYQPTFDLIIDENDLEEFRSSLITYINEESELSDLEVENTSSRDLGYRPLVATGTLTGGGFIEQAGPNFILKVGSMIGPQVEMYQKKDVRTMDVQSAYARTYHREIEFTIPEGYEVSGLEKSRINEEMKYEGEVSAAFYSDYTVDGNKVTISIEEFYELPVYPKEVFQDFKRVINAAADFNKVSLLLKKS